jgi:pimeloyl-ACP methyl ester carboxylesterase
MTTQQTVLPPHVVPAGDRRITQAEATQERRTDSLESFDIGGTTQWVLLRGNPLAGRVLLIVQQGPGLPLIHEADAIERRLRVEPHALVAYWDQRGTGRSCGADLATLDVARLVSDVRDMVDTLCARLQVDRVDIAGFSLGATLATMAAAQDPARIGNVVAVGIDVDFAESERYAYAFACDEAARRGDRRAQRQLHEIGAPPHDTSKRFLTRVRWVTEYGGVQRKLGFFGLLLANVWMLLSSPHYSIRQAVRALRAIEVTQGQMLAHLQNFDLRSVVSRVDVPIAFFQGRHDFATPPHLVARYVDALDVPRGKSLVWFEESAHMPHYEEPAHFREALLRALDIKPSVVAA